MDGADMTRDLDGFLARLKRLEKMMKEDEEDDEEDEEVPEWCNERWTD